MIEGKGGDADEECVDGKGWDRTRGEGQGGEMAKGKKSTYIITKTSTHASRRLGRWVCRQRVTGC